MISMVISTLLLSKGAGNLVLNPGFVMKGVDSRSPASFQLDGSAKWSWVGYSDETPIRGIRFNSFGDDTKGSVSQMVTGLNYGNGHWVRFSFRGRADDGFSVAHDRLFMKIDFYGKSGMNYIDSAVRLIYREVVKDRRDFNTNGNNGKAGAAVWRTYSFEELLPFKEIDSLKLSVGLEGGNAKAKDFSQFCATDFSLVQLRASSEGKVEPNAQTQSQESSGSAGDLVALGGKWYYRALPGENITIGSNQRLTKPLTVTEDNADRLFYKDDRLTNPFAGNMTAWLRKGYLDIHGRLVTEDRLVKDNVTITFDASDYWTVHARNIPNHQTAKFPDTYGTQGYNPSYIQEHNYTYHFPLNPHPNSNAIAMTAHDANGALNMGTVGIAVNGVAFYNPFDAGMEDASSIMDRCCGHPSPDNRYHYHKYPICVNTPFVDKGNAHSPVIGFALDGLPVYGPYEEADVMARDSKTNPLNAFNAHYDAVRGWHYHVTPGKFPYIIGGYLAGHW